MKTGAQTIIECANETEEACKNLAKQWKRVIGAPDPETLHPFGDIARGMDFHLLSAHKSLAAARRMLKTKEGITVYALVGTFNQACRTVLQFHDDYVQRYIQNYGEPPVIEQLHKYAEQVRSTSDKVEFRIRSVLQSHSSDHQLVQFGARLRKTVRNETASTAKSKRVSAKTSRKKTMRDV